jgi:D-sedoheptulose 7-phosphate isomerase
MMNFVEDYFNEVIGIASQIEPDEIEFFVKALNETKDEGGRVFVLGVGGSAGNASHMVNDLRKLCRIEAYAPTDNTSELTARTNDEGFDTVFEQFLRVSKFDMDDTIFVLSVGGGNEVKNVSVGLINAIKYAKEQNGTVLSIVGKPDGYAATNSNVALVVPIVEPSRVTPHSEAFQAVVWHCVVSHPELQVNATKW